MIIETTQTLNPLTIRMKTSFVINPAPEPCLVVGRRLSKLLGAPQGHAQEIVERVRGSWTVLEAWIGRSELVLLFDNVAERIARSYVAKLSQDLMEWAQVAEEFQLA